MFLKTEPHSPEFPVNFADRTTRTWSRASITNPIQTHEGVFSFSSRLLSSRDRSGLIMETNRQHHSSRTKLTTGEPDTRRIELFMYIIPSPVRPSLPMIWMTFPVSIINIRPGSSFSISSDSDFHNAISRSGSGNWLIRFMGAEAVRMEIYLWKWCWSIKILIEYFCVPYLH